MECLALRVDARSYPDEDVTFPPRLGSVVVAIPAARLQEFAEAALSSTSYLALSPVTAP